MIGVQALMRITRCRESWLTHGTLSLLEKTGTDLGKRGWYIEENKNHRSLKQTSGYFPFFAFNTYPAFADSVTLHPSRMEMCSTVTGLAVWTTRFGNSATKPWTLSPSAALITLNSFTGDKLRH